MYTLYWSAECGSFAPNAALAEAGVEFDLIEVDLAAGAHHAPEFLAINPRAQVPVLRLPDGTAMTESAAMMIHIADCHPDSRLLPPAGHPDRAKAYRWLFFGAVNIYESGCRISDPQHYSDHEPDFDGLRARARLDLDRYWDMVEEVLVEPPFVLGAAFSAVDIFLLMMSQWHPDTTGLLRRLPALKALYDATRSRPAIAAIWDRSFPG